MYVELLIRERLRVVGDCRVSIGWRNLTSAPTYSLNKLEFIGGGLAEQSVRYCYNCGSKSEDQIKQAIEECCGSIGDLGGWVLTNAEKFIPLLQQYLPCVQESKEANKAGLQALVTKAKASGLGGGITSPVPESDETVSAAPNANSKPAAATPSAVPALTGGPGS